MEDFVYMLSPMDKVTTAKVRSNLYKNGADVTFTEMARISALTRNNKSTLSKIEITDGTPTYIQIIGSQENDLDKFLQTFKPQKGFLGFNLNLGCPSPNMTNRGYGCAMIKRIQKVKKIIGVIQKHNYSASIKMRLGANKFEKEKKVYLNLINEVDADFFIVHAKHGKEDSEGPVDMNAYVECVQTGKKIIANGGIHTKEQVDELKAMGLAGVMIGSTAIKNYKIFRELKEKD